MYLNEYDDSYSDSDNEEVVKKPDEEVVKKPDEEIQKTYTNIYPKSYEDADEEFKKYQDIVAKLKTIKNITLELYDKFIGMIEELWLSHHNIIIKEIIKIKLLLIENCEVNFDDNKFDNFGYILSDNPLEDDIRKDKVPKIFGKYFYIYFLDFDCNLQSIHRDKKAKDFSNKKDFENQIIRLVNDKVCLTVHGQYPCYVINSNKLGNSFERINELQIDPEILKILQKEYKSKINGRLNTIEEVKEFIST